MLFSERFRLIILNYSSARQINFGDRFLIAPCGVRNSFGLRIIKMKRRAHPISWNVWEWLRHALEWAGVGWHLPSKFLRFCGGLCYVTPPPAPFWEFAFDILIMLKGICLTCSGGVGFWLKQTQSSLSKHDRFRWFNIFHVIYSRRFSSKYELNPPRLVHFSCWEPFMGDSNISNHILFLTKLFTIIGNFNWFSVTTSSWKGEVNKRFKCKNVV